VQGCFRPLRRGLAEDSRVEGSFHALGEEREIALLVPGLGKTLPLTFSRKSSRPSELGA